MAEPKTIDEQRLHVATCMGLYPDPAYWPMEIIDRLVELRQRAGEREMLEEIVRMMKGPRYG